MTLIVAVSDGHTSWMGGESYGSVGDGKEIVPPKIVKRTTALFGTAGMSRLCNLGDRAFAEWYDESPGASVDDLSDLLYTHFEPVRDDTRIEDSDYTFSAILAQEGELYVFGEQLDITHIVGTLPYFTAIGSPAPYALGVLTTLMHYDEPKDEEAKIKMVFHHTMNYSSEISKPFYLYRVSRERNLHE